MICLLGPSKASGPERSGSSGSLSLRVIACRKALVCGCIPLATWLRWYVRVLLPSCNNRFLLTSRACIPASCKSELQIDVDAHRCLPRASITVRVPGHARPKDKARTGLHRAMPPGAAISKGHASRGAHAARPSCFVLVSPCHFRMYLVTSQDTSFVRPRAS